MSEAIGTVKCAGTSPGSDASSMTASASRGRAVVADWKERTQTLESLSTRACDVARVDCDAMERGDREVGIRARSAAQAQLS